MTKISICICTRDRQEGLLIALDSLENMKIPTDVEVKIIVVENNNNNDSELIVFDFAAKSRFEFCYSLETRKGLAYARNKSVKEAGDCDFCCFVDDDQVVDSNWLVELLRCRNEFNSDGVYCSCIPRFNKKVAPYILNFHEFEQYEYGTILKTAATGGLLLSKKYLDMVEGPFDLKFNFTGGEDIYMTNAVSNLGAVIRYTPHAKTYEIIPENRTTIKYIIKRTYRNSNTLLLVKTLIYRKKTGWYAFPKLIVRFGKGLLIIFPYLLFGNANKLIGIVKIVDAIGGLSFIFGRKNKFYK